MIFHIFRRVRSRLRQVGPPGRFLAFCGILLAVSLIFIVLHRGFEDVSWGTSAWVVWQTATTVGYGDFPPATVGGRIVTVLAGTIGIAFVGVLISGAFDLKQFFSDRRRLGMTENPFHDGYVLFNYPGEDRLLTFIREIRTVEPEAGICIVDGKLRELPDNLTARFAKLHFVKGNVLDRKTYEAARLNDNKAVIIFPPDPQASSSDGTTKTLVELVNRFTKPPTRIIHVLVNPENRWMFGSESAPVWQSLEMLALVQECQDPYSSEVIAQLLSNSEGANPRSVKPARIGGWTWGEFQKKAIEHAHSQGMTVNPVALIRPGGRKETCPDPGLKIGEDDRILIIARPGFDWSEFEKGLA